MKKLLKILNPIIFIINLFKYQAHIGIGPQAKNPDPYDFSKDLKYF